MTWRKNRSCWFLMPSCSTSCNSSSLALLPVVLGAVLVLLLSEQKYTAHAASFVLVSYKTTTTRTTTKTSQGGTTIRQQPTPFPLLTRAKANTNDKDSDNVPNDIQLHENNNNNKNVTIDDHNNNNNNDNETRTVITATTTSTKKTDTVQAEPDPPPVSDAGVRLLDPSASPTAAALVRIKGVSVSSTSHGFWVFLQRSQSSNNNNNNNNNNHDTNDWLALQITDDPLDRYATTSPEALTFLQLLVANVDMAGAILPPDILSQILVLHCEEQQQQQLKQQQEDGQDETTTTFTNNNSQNDDHDNTMRQQIVESVSQSVQKVRSQYLKQQQQQQQQQQSSTTTTVQDQDSWSSSLYSEQHPWIRSRTSLPTCRLSELNIHTLVSTKTQQKTIHFLWTVIADVPQNNNNNNSKTRNDKSRPTSRWELTFQPTDSMLQEVMYQYRPRVSVAFLSLALALRYKVPILWTQHQADHIRDGTNTLLINNKRVQLTSTLAATATTTPTFSTTTTYNSTASTDIGPHSAFGMASSFTSSNNNNNNNNKTRSELPDVLRRAFPMYSSSTELQQTPQRVATNIERSYEIHRLNAALQIAIDRADWKAVDKIRAAMDEMGMDKLDDLPVQDESDFASMQ